MVGAHSTLQKQDFKGINLFILGVLLGVLIKFEYTKNHKKQRVVIFSDDPEPTPIVVNGVHIQVETVNGQFRFESNSPYWGHKWGHNLYYR